MYPNLYYAFKELFAIEWPFLRFLNTYGIFMATAFVVVAAMLYVSLKRKERTGCLTYTTEKEIVGERATTSELVVNFLIGFFIGYKLLGLFLADSNDTTDPQAYIFSSKGNWIVGILIGGSLATLKWWQKDRRKLAKPQKKTIQIWPHDRVIEILIIAILSGFAGAKIFYILENASAFFDDPLGNLLSFTGITFYGALLSAAAAIGLYLKRHSIDFRHFCDAAAPGVVLAYAIIRLGCHTSGDGDWGVLNSAYITSTSGIVQPADSSVFQQQLELHKAYYQAEFGSADIKDVPQYSFKGPAGVPLWLIAYHYPNNVLSTGTPIDQCQEPAYCHQLPIPVFPTSLYESIFALLIFCALWIVQSFISFPGGVLSIYLILNGIARFLVEGIRINQKYDLLGWEFSIAQIISIGLCAAGVYLWYRFSQQKATVVG